jgi:hypothetical protein
MRFRGLGLALSVCLVALGGCLVFAAAPVLAAAPETPESEKASAIGATGATLEGVLNPKAVGAVEGGEYLFLYNQSGTECEGAFVAPEPPGVAAGLPQEPKVEKLEGLQPSTTYTFCLEEITPGGTAKGLPVSFTTGPAPPQILSESVSEVRPTEATLDAAINPNNQETTYKFEYATEATGEVLKGTIVTLNGAGPLSGFGEQGVGVATGAVLTHGTTYYDRVVAKNATGEETVGKVEHFTTPITPETPEGLVGEAVGTGFKLKGVLNPKEKGDPGTYEFLYEQSATECTGTGGQATPPQAATGATPEPVEGEVMGLLPNTEYTFCLRARNEAGEESAPSTPVTLTTLQVAPSVGGESFANVGSSSATLHAQVFPGGAPMSYFFEYGPTEAYGSRTPLESAGAGATPVSVLANIEGLQPDTTYHFRIVLDNIRGEANGDDTTFSTLPLPISGLPDGRGYELVSPLSSGHATVVPGRPGVRAAADGSKVTYLVTTPPVGGIGHGEPPPPETDQGAETNSGDNQYFAERSATNGWTAVNIQPAGINTAVYQSFSSDLSEAILQSAEPLSENAPSSKYAGLYLQSTATGAFSPLFTRTPTHVGISGPTGGFSAVFAGASLDGSHRLFEANGVLLEGASPEAEELNTFANEKAVHPLYDSTSGRLVAVDILPDGRVAPEASYGSPEVASGPQGGFHRLDRIVSADGSRIFWTDTSTVSSVEDPSGATRLFVREDDASSDASTVQIDASQAPAGSGAVEVKERAERSGAGVFMIASSDGSKVYFTDERKLTANSIAAPGEPDLYLYNFEAPVGERLTDLTTGVQNAGLEHARVMGVLGTSEDGSYVYFAATGALSPEAKQQECTPTPTALCNVYALHIGESPRLVATVTYYDGEGGVTRNSGHAVPIKPSEEEEIGDWVPFVGSRTAQVSVDGRHLVFESVVPQVTQNFTGFDGGGSREIYLYDFGSALSCVSCNPAGVPSLSSEHYAMHFELPESFSSTYALRDLSDDGDRVFFNSKEALVPNDTNSRTDVYEWERYGSGSCARLKGCLFLLSGGTSSNYSAFLDASASGDDVFIETRAHLLPQVGGEVYEVYDARVGAPPESAAPMCSGTGCQGVPGAPPIFATPSSVTFNGIGNFPRPPSSSPTKKETAAEKLAKALGVCRKDRAKKKRASCEKSARKQYGATKTKAKAKIKARKAGVYRRAK